MKESRRKKDKQIDKQRRAKDAKARSQSSTGECRCPDTGNLRLRIGFFMTSVNKTQQQGRMLNWALLHLFGGFGAVTG